MSKSAFQIYKEWKAVNEDASDVSENEQSDEEYVPPKKKTKKESKKVEETKPKLKLKKKENETQSNTIDKFFKKDTKVETIVLESDEEIESFSSGDEFIDEEDEVVEID